MAVRNLVGDKNIPSADRSFLSQGEQANVNQRASGELNIPSGTLQAVASPSGHGSGRSNGITNPGL